MKPKSLKSDIRASLLQKGFFPEVLPPCFDSYDLKRGFQGIIKDLEAKKFYKDRSSNYIRYSGTKHDGNRRPYGTVNPIPYFSVVNFIATHWKEFTDKLENSKYSLESLRLGSKDEDRAIIIPTLSELSERMSSKIRYSPYVVKTDIAQFFPSIYTHSISWAAHGIDQAKADQDKKSKANYFNQLDWFTQQCQNAQTRGVIIGPDAFRIIAEFISCEIDKSIEDRSSKRIIGAIRHVDDYYIGVRSEIEGTAILSQLRDILQNYELQLNDTKTKSISGLEPIDDIWAQELRETHFYNSDSSQINFLLDKAYDLSRAISSQSPMKLALRLIDKKKIYKHESWERIEPKLQRILYHFPHCIDYVCLLLVKRYAIGKTIDTEGWNKICSISLRKHLNSNHHHEVCWLLWTIFVSGLEISDALISASCKIQNAHVKSLIIAGYQEGYISTKPALTLGAKLNSSDDSWLLNLVGRTFGYSNAPFSGAFANEFEHFASKNVRLINFKKHIKLVSEDKYEAISRSKYGYDADDYDGDGDYPDLSDLF